MTHKNTAWKAPLEVIPCSPSLAAAQQVSRGSLDELGSPKDGTSGPLQCPPWLGGTLV